MLFDDDSFDVVYTINTLHHVPDLKDFIREMARVTKPGGCIVIGHQHLYKWLDAPVPGLMEKAELMFPHETRTSLSGLLSGLLLILEWAKTLKLLTLGVARAYIQRDYQNTMQSLLVLIFQKTH